VGDMAGWVNDDSPWDGLSEEPDGGRSCPRRPDCDGRIGPVYKYDRKNKMMVPTFKKCPDCSPPSHTR